MRDPERIDRILEKVGRFWKEVPDWRLGQLVSNLIGTGPQDVFHLEDTQLEQALDDVLGDNARMT